MTFLLFSIRRKIKECSRLQGNMNLPVKNIRKKELIMEIIKKNKLNIKINLAYKRFTID
jgi:hypothetical protein